MRSYPLRLGDAGWRVDTDRLAAAIGERTKALVVVSLNNPTGPFATPAERTAIEGLARLEVIADTYLSVAPPVQSALPGLLALRAPPDGGTEGVTVSTGTSIFGAAMSSTHPLPLPRPHRTGDDLQFHVDNVTRHGFTVIAEVLSTQDLAYLRTILDPIYQAYDPERDGLRRVEGYHFAANLVDKDAFFEALFLRDAVYGLVRHFLGDDCNLSSLNSLEPRRGNPLQGLHRDGGFPLSDSLQSMNTWWVVDDMDAANGATRVVPGSHLTDEAPGAYETEAVQVAAPAGCVVATNARLVHGACVNHNGRRRRVLHTYWVRAGEPQQTEQRRYLSTAVQARLPARARAVLRLD